MSHIDDLKRIDYEKHDAVIFDDMSFKHWPVTSCIHLLDCEQDRTINIRYGNVVLRAGFPRVFISNNPIWPPFEEALARRMALAEVTVDMRDGGDESNPQVVNTLAPTIDAWLVGGAMSGFVFRD